MILDYEKAAEHVQTRWALWISFAIYLNSKAYTIDFHAYSLKADNS